MVSQLVKEVVFHQIEWVFNNQVIMKIGKEMISKITWENSSVATIKGLDSNMLTKLMRKQCIRLELSRMSRLRLEIASYRTAKMAL